jgi:predicted methyltransferase
MLSRPLLLPALALTAAFFAAPAFFASYALAQTVPPAVAAAVSDKVRPDADTKRDADRRPAESIAFAGVKPGDNVLELLAFGGYYTRILAKTVGPKGHVYSTMPDALLQTRPAMGDGLKAIAADPAYGNVTMLPQPNGTPTAPVPVDVVWTSDNYHDLHNPGPFGASDIPGFNKAVFAALKPGGTFIVIDHAAAAGSGLTATGTLHRIDPEVVKKEVMAAGFTFAGASDVLHRTNEDFTAKASDADEQFTFKFKKP